MIVNGKPRRLDGWRRGAKHPLDATLASFLAAALPPSADLRSLCPPVGDQGQLGSCTANAGCEALEFLERQGQRDTLYSRLFVYARTRQLEGTPLSEDSGAQVRDTVEALARFGACLESTWPYDVDAFCQEPSEDAAKEALLHKAVLYYACPNLFTVKASLAQGFPVAFGFEVYDSMMSAAVASSGIVPFPTAQDSVVGGHAVLAVGYDDSRQAVLVQNSWGTGWGLGGFFWLPYRYWDDGLADDCWTLRRAT